MPRFTATAGRFEPHETVILADAATGATAEIALLGATLLRYAVPLHGAVMDITDGFATPEEFAAKKAGRAILMAPFSNRIRNAEYTFLGTRRELPSSDPTARKILHGFARDLAFAVAPESGDDAATATFTSSALRPGFVAGYPFAIDLTFTFALTARDLRLTLCGKNVGTEPAPFASGWHPYFKTGSRGIDHLLLGIPCRQKIVTDEGLIPLDGEAAYVPIGQAKEFDFRPRKGGKARALGNTVIDGCFSRLVPDSDGWCRTWIQDPENDVRITLFQDQGLMHVFTGDPLPIRPRQSIALEPVQAMTNAYNRPECEKAITLKPGRSSTFRFGAEAQVVTWPRKRR